MFVCFYLVEDVCLFSGFLFNFDFVMGLYECYIYYKVGDMIFVKFDEEILFEKLLDFNIDKDSSFDIDLLMLKVGGI